MRLNQVVIPKDVVDTNGHLSLSALWNVLSANENQVPRNQGLKKIFCKKIQNENRFVKKKHR